jgi:hypothetical protein
MRTSRTLRHCSADGSLALNAETVLSFFVEDATGARIQWNGLNDNKRARRPIRWMPPPPPPPRAMNGLQQQTHKTNFFHKMLRVFSCFFSACDTMIAL